MNDIDMAKIKEIMGKVAPRWLDVEENDAPPPQGESANELTEFIAFAVLKRLVEELNEPGAVISDEVTTKISFTLKNLGQERLGGRCTGSGWPDKFSVVFDNS